MNQIDDLIEVAARGEFSHIRLSIPLSPLHEKVCPATYLGADNKPVFAQEERMVEDKIVPTILLDSIAANANQFEAALLNEVRCHGISLPHLICKIKGIGEVLDDVTSLELPHRTFDQFINKSTLGGVRFRDSAIGRELLAATPKNATPLFTYDPVSLLLGVWGQGFGLARLRFARSLQSEIVAYGAVAGVKTSSKSDAFNVPKSISIYTSHKDTTNDFRLVQQGDFQNKESPAAVTLGMIPPSVRETGGITARSYRQNIGFMLAQLRAYHFPVGGKITPETDLAARKVLIALGLLAIAANCQHGYAIRSGCAFQIQSVAGPDGILHDLAIEFLGNSTRNNRVEYADVTEDFLDELRASVGAAIAQAKAAGLPWHDPGVALEPDTELRLLLGMSADEKKASRTKKPIAA